MRLRSLARKMDETPMQFYSTLARELGTMRSISAQHASSFVAEPVTAVTSYPHDFVAQTPLAFRSHLKQRRTAVSRGEISLNEIHKIYLHKGHNG